MTSIFKMVYVVISTKSHDFVSLVTLVGLFVTQAHNAQKRERRKGGGSDKAPICVTSFTNDP